jgi:polar amino acid transport system substrate-binding protein
MKVKNTIMVIVIISLFIIANFAMAEEVTIGYPEHYPLTYQGPTGEAEGFIIDLLKSIDAGTPDYTFNYVYGNWSETLNALSQGEVDLVAGLVASESRAKVFDFNEATMYLSWGTVILREEHSVESILDLEGMTLGHLMGDYFAEGHRGLINKLYDFQLEVSYKGYGSYTDLLKAIEGGDVDAGIMDQVSTRSIYDYDNIKDTGLVFAASGLKIASLKNQNNEVLDLVDNKMNTWLNDKDSFYYERYNAYFDKEFIQGFIPFYRSYKKIIWFVLFWILLLLGYGALELYLRTKESKDRRKYLKEVMKKSQKILKKKQETIQEKALAVDGLQEHLNKFEDLMTFITRNVSLNHTNAEEDLFKEILDQAFDLVGSADFGFAYIFDEKNNFKIVECIHTKKPEIKGIQMHHLPPIDPPVQIVKNLRSETINFCSNDKVKREIYKGFKETKESLVVLFKNNKRPYGGLVLEIEEGSEKNFKESAIESMQALKNIAEGYFLNENYYKMDIIFQKEMIFSLIKILELHDLYTKGHSQGVADLSKDLAEYMGLSEMKADEIYWAGLVHDIGKILISAKTINKIDPLTKSEYKNIKKHSIYGYEALKKSEVTEKIATIVLYHHERYDGKGYPEGLSGENIPLASRIISVVDSYDAMVSDRVYKSKKTHREALKEIEENLGTQFDPIVGRQFIEMKKEEDEIHEETNHERYREKSRGFQSNGF